jgi:hypothetical protein
MNMMAVPEWTEYRKKNGLDPLGMQNTSVSLYQTLLPGISNVTLRIRYYGLYAWLSSVYARQIGDTDPKTWQRFLRRAEALYALTAQHHGNETGVAGIVWAQAKRAAAESGEVAFADDAEPGSPTHYLKQAWGAYGAAYGSQLFEIGILSQAQGHVIPVPSPEVGEVVGNSFEKVLDGIGPRFIETIERGTARLADLDAFAVMAPSEIGAESEERQLYEELLFARTTLQRPADLNRRKTLLLILKLAQQLGRPPEIMDVRWALYAGCLPNGTKLSLPADLEAQRRRWWAYQANDLSHICFETLLKYVLDALAAYPDGLPLGNLIAEVVSEILAAADMRPADWADFLMQTPPAANAWSPDGALTDLALTERLMKAARQEMQCAAETAWMALRLLATVHNRVQGSSKEISDTLGGFDATAFRSVLTETRFLDARLRAPFEHTLARLIEERVIRRHLWIALRKLRYQGDYTFLMEADNGRVRLRELDGPVYTNPRLGPSITFLRDIHLLAADGLTQQGARCIGAAA